MRLDSWTKRRAHTVQFSRNECVGGDGGDFFCASERPVAGVNHINTEFRIGSMQLPVLFSPFLSYLSPISLSLSLLLFSCLLLSLFLLLGQHSPAGVTIRIALLVAPPDAISTTGARTPSSAKGFPSRSFASSKEIVVRVLMKKKIASLPHRDVA